MEIRTSQLDDWVGVNLFNFVPKRKTDLNNKLDSCVERKILYRMSEEQSIWNAFPSSKKWNKSVPFFMGHPLFLLIVTLTNNTRAAIKYDYFCISWLVQFGFEKKWH